MPQHIVAIGGGSFLTPDNPMDDFVLGLAGQDRPRVCLIPTAMGDSDSTIAAWYSPYGRARCELSHLTLFHREVADIARFLCSQHVIYVAGGNTANLLAIWRVHGLDTALRLAWEQGVVLCGVSAGSLCWFEAAITDSFGQQLAPLYDGLGFLPGSNCPHYDGEVNRRPVYRQAIVDGFPAGIAAEDGVGLHFQGTELVEAVTSRPTARAFRLQRENDGVLETALPTRYLG